MKLALSLLTLSMSLYAINYEGCSDTKQNALHSLSGNIKSTIQSSFKETMKSDSTLGDDETIETTISSYINASTNLSLVNIKYRRKNENEVCAYINSVDQTKNTKELLSKALLYDEKNLPKDIDEKVKILSQWINDIKELEYLTPVFLENSQNAQKILNKKTKVFKDLYTDSLTKSDSLIWKSCAKTKEDSKLALNQKLFINKGKEEGKSFFTSILSVFDSKEKPLIELFDSQIQYTKQENKICSFIKKDALLKVADKMNNNVKMFTIKSLDQNPIKKYKQIENYIKHLDISKKLLELYPKIYLSKDFNKIVVIKNQLSEIKKKTYPQYVIFNIKGEQGITIKLDDKIIENNIAKYIVDGEHSYTISTKNKCPIVGTFTLDAFDNEKISEDFSSNDYPKVLFITDKTPNIVVDGNVVKANISTPIHKCEGNVRYIVRFQGQSKSGELKLSPNEKYPIELNFLTSKELSVFNDAKSKSFDTKGNLKFSESLTPIISENLKFSLEEKPNHGKVEIHESGSFKYTPDENYVGVDSFEYSIETSDKVSPPKIVNITVSGSKIIPKIVKAEKAVKKEDLNGTKNLVEDKIAEIQKDIEKNPKLKELKKNIEENVEIIEKKSKEYLKESEDKYNRFKAYVNSQEQNIEKLKKLQQKYPEMFNRLLKEKTGQ